MYIYCVLGCVRSMQHSTVEMGCTFTSLDLPLLLHVACSQTTTFLRSDTTATIFYGVCLVRLLFEGGVYFVEEPVDINDG